MNYPVRNSKIDEALAKAMEREKKNVQEIVRYVIEVERLNSALNQEKLNLKEEKAKQQTFSSLFPSVIENQEKEIKHLNIALDQAKKEIKESESELSETRNALTFPKIKAKLTKLEVTHLQTEAKERHLAKEKAKNQEFYDVIENQEKEIKRLRIALDQTKEGINEIFLRINKQRSELKQGKAEKFKLIQGKDEETEKIKYLVDYMTEVHRYIRYLNETLNNEKLEKLNLIREKDKAIDDAKAQGFKDVQEIVRDVIEIQQIKNNWSKQGRQW